MCQNCDKRFPTNFLLKQHVDISHKGLNKRHMCDRCGKGFAYKNGIKDHPCRPGKTLFHFEIVIGLILILWYIFALSSNGNKFTPAQAENMDWLARGEILQLFTPCPFWITFLSKVSNFFGGENWHQSYYRVFTLALSYFKPRFI